MHSEPQGLTIAEKDSAMPDRDVAAEPFKTEGRNPRSMFDVGPRPFGIVPNEPQPRPKGDPVLCKAAFDRAFTRPEPRSLPNHGVTLNALLLEVFGREELLPLPAFVAAHDHIVKERARRIERYPRPDPDPFAYEMAGIFAGQCFRLRLVASDGTEEDLPRFRLLDREMQFAIHGRRAVRVRGLTPAEQERRDKLDRKARDAATSEIGCLINELVRLDRHRVVPASWHAAGFLPEDLVGRGIAEAAAFIVEYHQVAAFERTKLADWLSCLASSVEHAARPLSPSGAGGVPRSERIVPDDMDALMALARTKGAGPGTEDL